MSLEYFAGVPGVAINIETPQDLYDAIDTLHAQVMEAFGEEHNPYLPVLEAAMQRLTDEFSLFPS